MKKVIIAKPIRKLLEQESSFLDRKDMQVFTAATNDEVLAVHRAERADLIVTRLDLPGMAAEELVQHGPRGSWPPPGLDDPGLSGNPGSRWRNARGAR